MDFNITQNLLLRGGAIHPSLRQDESKCRKARVRLARLGGLAIAPIMNLFWKRPEHVTILQTPVLRDFVGCTYN
jgi:hypothetical protein